MRGKHESGPPAVPGGTGSANGSPARTPLRILMLSRWRLISGAASATAAAFCLVAFACSLVAVAGPRARARPSRWSSNAFRQRLRDSRVVGAGPAMGAMDAQSLGTALNRTVGAAQIAVVKADLRQNLGKTRLPSTMPRRLPAWTAALTALVAGLARGRDVASRMLGGKLELVYRDTLSKNVHLVAGSLPAGSPDSGAQANATVQVAVTTVTAKRFNLRIGSRVPFGATVLQVTGIVTPVNQRAAPFWTVDRRRAATRARPGAARRADARPVSHFDPCQRASPDRAGLARRHRDRPAGPGDGDSDRPDGAC